MESSVKSWLLALRPFMVFPPTVVWIHVRSTRNGHTTFDHSAVPIQSAPPDTTTSRGL